jgi:hypothetical protein
VECRETGSRNTLQCLNDTIAGAFSAVVSIWLTRGIKARPEVELHCVYNVSVRYQLHFAVTVLSFLLQSPVFELSLVHTASVLYTALKLSDYKPRRRLGERRYSSYSFAISALDGGEWSASRPGRAFTPGERTSGTHCTGGWVGPRAGLDTEARGKPFGLCRESNLDRPVVQPVVRHCTAWATQVTQRALSAEICLSEEIYLVSV